MGDEADFDQIVQVAACPHDYFERLGNGAVVSAQGLQQVGQGPVIDLRLPHIIR
jgi:hypothetical protein